LSIRGESVENVRAVMQTQAGAFPIRGGLAAMGIASDPSDLIEHDRRALSLTVATPIW